MSEFFSDKLIVVRGGGDLASGTIHRLVRCGFPVLVLEATHPSAIRRQVSFSEAVYNGNAEIEGVICERTETLSQAREILQLGHAALLVDPEGLVFRSLRPWAVIDAILAKRNLGTNRSLADKTIALGPGFTAGKDVDLVIETKRGHNLGRIISEGSAAHNTGIPGLIAGYGSERVLRSPARGTFHSLAAIGDTVEKGQILARIIPEGADAAQAVPVCASLTGLLRGMLRDGYPVTPGFKLADIDPRIEEYENCFTISDKARCIAGSVLEGLLYLEHCSSRPCL